jgi:hypothetical protein
MYIYNVYLDMYMYIRMYVVVARTRSVALQKDCVRVESEQDLFESFFCIIWSACCSIHNLIINLGNDRRESTKTRNQSSTQRVT